jgi:hypothetical protein
MTGLGGFTRQLAYLTELLIAAHSHLPMFRVREDSIDFSRWKRTRGNGARTCEPVCPGEAALAHWR